MAEEGKAAPAEEGKAAPPLEPPVAEVPVPEVLEVPVEVHGAGVDPAEEEAKMPAGPKFGDPIPKGHKDEIPFYPPPPEYKHPDILYHNALSLLKMHIAQTTDRNTLRIYLQWKKILEQWGKEHKVAHSIWGYREPTPLQMAEAEQFLASITGNTNLTAALAERVETEQMLQDQSSIKEYLSKGSNMYQAMTSISRVLGKGAKSLLGLTIKAAGSTPALLNRLKGTFQSNEQPKLQANQATTSHLQSILASIRPGQPISKSTPVHRSTPRMPKRVMEDIVEEEEDILPYLYVNLAIPDVEPLLDKVIGQIEQILPSIDQIVFLYWDPDARFHKYVMSAEAFDTEINDFLENEATNIEIGYSPKLWEVLRPMKWQNTHQNLTQQAIRKEFNKPISYYERRIH